MKSAVKFQVIIPARLNSSRLPGKVLLPIGSKPMIQHVYERALASGAGSVLIATDSDAVKKAVEIFSGNVLMTKASHPSGTDRLAEAVSRCGLADEVIIVNVQGDEPLIPVELIQQVANNLHSNPTCVVATLAKPLHCYEDLLNPDIVKVVADKHGNALYFSRSAIPYTRDDGDGQSYNNRHFSMGVSVALTDGCHHIGIYAYRCGFLKKYQQLTMCALEKKESLEQLRVLWHGYKIHVAMACVATQPEVNNQAQLELVRKIYHFLHQQTKEGIP